MELFVCSIRRKALSDEELAAIDAKQKEDREAKKAQKRKKTKGKRKGRGKKAKKQKVDDTVVEPVATVGDTAQ